MRHAKTLSHAGRQVGVTERVLEWSEHECQRRAKLMTDIGEECSLGAIDFRQRLCAFALFLVSTRICHGSADVSCNQIEKAPILGIDDATRTESGNQKSRRLAVTRRRNRQHNRALTRLTPWSTGCDPDSVR